MYPHKGSACPAKGKTRNKCGKANHFAKVCQSQFHSVRKPTKYSKKHVNPVSKQTCYEDQFTSDSDCHYLYAFDKKDQARALVTAKVNYFQCKLLVDTGASVNVLDELHTISFLQYILRSFYANELRTMASMRGVVPFCLARPHLGSGREFSSWCPLLPIFAIRSSSFFSYFSSLKSTFPLGPSLLSFFAVTAVLNERFDRVKLHGSCVQSNEGDFALIYRGVRFF